MPRLHARQCVVHQIGGYLDRSSHATRRTDAALLVTVRYQRIAVAAVTDQPEESIREDTAVEIDFKFVFNELGQGVNFGDKRRIASQDIDTEMVPNAKRIDMDFKDGSK